jgi:hypothetical protein
VVRLEKLDLLQKGSGSSQSFFGILLAILAAEQRRAFRLQVLLPRFKQWSHVAN